MKNKSKIETREQWLEHAVELLSPLFAQHGYTIPDGLEPVGDE